jgi:hypothetical protein
MFQILEKLTSSSGFYRDYLSNKTNDMKRILLILILSQIIISCQKAEKIKVSDYSAEINKINASLSIVTENKQVFSIPAKEVRIVEANNGLKIRVDASRLETEDGSPLSDSITIEVLVCLNQFDFIQASIKTISEGRLLVSGGAYNIKMTSGGKKLKIKNKNPITVYLPRYTNDEMELFYGQKDSIGQVEWLEANKKLDSNIQVSLPDKRSIPGKLLSDTIINPTHYYEPIEISSLDWINCDRFYDIKEKTNIKLDIETEQDSIVVMVYLIFKDINSVTSAEYIKSGNEILNEGFVDMPVNQNVKMVAISLIKDKMYKFSKDFTIQKDETIKINLTPSINQEPLELINKK